MSVLDNTPNLYPSYSTEYLDTKRRPMDEKYEEESVRYLVSKYQGYHPDLIYVTDDNALHFMLHHKQRLFPSVPVVFSGVNDLSRREQLRETSFTGIFETKKVMPNLKLVKKLFPDETSIAFIGDGSSTSQGIHESINKEITGYGEMKIHYFDNPDLESILAQLQTYKGKTVVLTTIGAFRTHEGELLSIEEVIQKIQKNGNFFLVALEDAYVKNGVAGGYAVDGLSQGSAAGRMALNILTHSTSSLPREDIDTNHWIFDFDVLERNGIKLPEDIADHARFLHLPKTFYQTHETLITRVIYILVGSLSLIGFLFTLFLYRSKKTGNEREAALVSLYDRLNKAQSIAHIGNWEWEIATGKIWWSDEIYRIFGLDTRKFTPSYDTFFSSIYVDDRESVQNAIDEALRSGSEYRVEHRITLPDGEIRHVLEEGVLEYDMNGSALRMNGTVWDISEQKEVHRILEASEKKYRDLVENAMIGVYRSEITGKVLYVNDALAKMLGYASPNDLMGQKSTKVYKNPLQREELLQILVKDRTLINQEIDFLDKTGAIVPVLLSATIEKDIVSGMIFDMREIKKSQKEIDKLSKVVEQIDDSVVITDANGKITYVNPAFCLHTGFTRDDAVGKTSRILKSGQHDKNYYDNMWKTILEGNVYRGTLINKKKNGDIFYEDKTITPITDDQNTIIGFVSSGKDITQESLLNQEIKRIAVTDKLTGIYNRHKFEELYLLEAERARRFSLPLSLILIDIDHFKIINDTYGHNVGDVVLIYLANIIRDNIRKIDVFARWGGEEFLVLSPGTDIQHAQKLAEKLRQSIENASFLDVGHITISLGVSTYAADDSLSALFKRADEGLYQAKANGRNQTGTAYEEVSILH